LRKKLFFLTVLLCALELLVCSQGECNSFIAKSECVSAQKDSFKELLSADLARFVAKDFVDFSNDQLKASIELKKYDQIPWYVSDVCTKDHLHHVCGKLFLGNDRVSCNLARGKDDLCGLPERPGLILFVGNLDQEMAEIEKKLTDLSLDVDVKNDLLEKLFGCLELKKTFGFVPGEVSVIGQLREVLVGKTRMIYLPLAEGKMVLFNTFQDQFVPHKKYIFDLVDQALKQNQAVLFHCIHGYNRSLAVLCAYLYEKVGHRYSWYAINSFVAAHRFGVVVLARMVSELKRGSKSGHCLLGVVEYYLGIKAQPVEDLGSPVSV